MKNYKIVQICADEPYSSRASERDMPQTVSNLQKEGYTIESVVISEPLLWLADADISSPNSSKTTHSYRTMITYLLVKEF